MTDTYFVCFEAGTSGRFVASIIWNLINNLYKNIEYSEQNSAHPNSYWALSWDTTSINHTSTNYPDIYKDFNFRHELSPLNPYGHGLLNTHIFPDFDTISRRFPTTKIILITYEIDDIPEICLNNVLKNGIEFFKSGPKTTKALYESLVFRIASKLLFLKYGDEVDVGTYKFSDNEIKEIVKEYTKTLTPYLETTKFLNAKITDNIKNEILILKYKELFIKTDSGFVGLDKLKDFTNTKINDTILESYTNYVTGRERVIDQYEIK